MPVPRPAVLYSAQPGAAATADLYSSAAGAGNPCSVSQPARADFSAGLGRTVPSTGQSSVAVTRHARLTQA